MKLFINSSTTSMALLPDRQALQPPSALSLPLHPFSFFSCMFVILPQGMSSHASHALQGYFYLQ